MKYVLGLILLTGALSALADERFVGSWVWSGNQCRDSELSAESALSTYKDPQGVSISSARIDIDNKGNARFRFSVQDHVGDESGTYTISGNRIDMGNESGGLTAWFIDNQLVSYNSEERVEACPSNEKFVRIFSRIDR